MRCLVACPSASAARDFLARDRLDQAIEGVEEGLGDLGREEITDGVLRTVGRARSSGSTRELTQVIVAEVAREL